MRRVRTSQALVMARLCGASHHSISNPFVGYASAEQFAKEAEGIALLAVGEHINRFDLGAKYAHMESFRPLDERP